MNYKNRVEQEIEEQSGRPPRVEREPGPFLFVGGPGDGMRLEVHSSAQQFRIPYPNRRPFDAGARAPIMESISCETYEPSIWCADHHDFTIFKPVSMSTQDVLRTLLQRYPRKGEVSVTVKTLEQVMEVVAELQMQVNLYSDPVKLNPEENKKLQKKCGVVHAQLCDAVMEQASGRLPNL